MKLLDAFEARGGPHRSRIRSEMSLCSARRTKTSTKKLVNGRPHSIWARKHACYLVREPELTACPITELAPDLLSPLAGCRRHRARIDCSRPGDDGIRRAGCRDGGRRPSRSRRTKNNAKAGLSRNSTAGPRPGTLIPGRVMERLSGPFHRASATPRRECRNRAFLGRIHRQRRRELRWPSRNERLQPLRRTTKYTDQPHQARAQASPRREEEHEVVKPHVRDGGPVERDDEEEEPQAEGDEGGDQAAAAGPFFTGAVHGGVSLADVASPGTEPTEAPTSIPVPPPP